MTEKLSIGAVLDRSFNIYGEHWKLLIGVSALIYGFVWAVLFLALSDGAGAVAFAFSAIAVVGGLLFLQGLIAVAASEFEAERTNIAIGTLFARATERLGPLLVTGLILVLILGAIILLAAWLASSVFVGFALLLIPMIVLAVWWALAIPVVMLEDRTGWDALKRSQALVRGNGGRLFAVLLIIGIATSIATEILGGIANALVPGRDSALSEAVEGFVGGAIVGPLQALVPVVAYLFLRNARGVGEHPPASPAGPAEPPLIS